MISSVEALRLSLEPGAVTLTLAVTPEDEAHEAIALFGFQLVPEPDGPPPTCGWCGRHDPLGGLADESLGGPPTYQCNDAEGCALARWEREPAWLASQVPGWEWQFRRHQAIEEQMNWLRSRAWAAYHPEQFALWREEVTPEFAYALSQVREMVDERAVPLAGGPAGAAGDAGPDRADADLARRVRPAQPAAEFQPPMPGFVVHPHDHAVPGQQDPHAGTSPAASQGDRRGIGARQESRPRVRVNHANAD